MQIALTNPDKIVRKRVRKEFNKFKISLLKKSKEQIIDNCNKIRFFCCIKEFFIYNEQISESTWKFLVDKDNIIHQMWNLYLKYEELEVDSWSNIEEIFAVWMLKQMRMIS